jgi:hypothetical protein
VHPHEHAPLVEHRIIEVAQLQHVGGAVSVLNDRFRGVSSGSGGASARERRSGARRYRCGHGPHSRVDRDERRNRYARRRSAQANGATRLGSRQWPSVCRPVRRPRCSPTSSSRRGCWAEPALPREREAVRSERTAVGDGLVSVHRYRVVDGAVGQRSDGDGRGYSCARRSASRRHRWARRLRLSTAGDGLGAAFGRAEDALCATVGF